MLPLGPSAAHAQEKFIVPAVGSLALICLNVVVVVCKNSQKLSSRSPKRRNKAGRPYPHCAYSKSYKYTMMSSNATPLRPRGSIMHDQWQE